jgi:predicted RecB family nuclease
MDRNGCRARRPDVVSASDLAEMGVCERRVLLEHRHGLRRTSAQETAMRRGLRAHERFHRDGVAAGRVASYRRRPTAFASFGRRFVGLCKRIALAVLRSLGGR